MSNHHDDAMVLHGDTNTIDELEKQLADFRCPGCNTAPTMVTDPDGIMYADIICTPECPENTDQEK